LGGGWCRGRGWGLKVYTQGVIGYTAVIGAAAKFRTNATLCTNRTEICATALVSCLTT
jgi:hypothetical protein